MRVKFGFKFQGPRNDSYVVLRKVKPSEMPIKIRLHRYHGDRDWKTIRRGNLWWVKAYAFADNEGPDWGVFPMREIDIIGWRKALGK